MRIGIDAMGGDSAPVEEVKGALSAGGILDAGDRIVLIGNEAAIRQQLSACAARVPAASACGGQAGAGGRERPAPCGGDWRDFIEIRHAEQVIGMNESPVDALRAKPDSSIAVMAQMQKDGDIDAGISAGNTGACVAAAQMRLRRLHGVHRPGIAVITRTPRGPLALCDVGANVNCRPQHLHQYAIMASVYLRAMVGTESPRVGLLSIGQEDAKGNELVKRTRDLLRGDPNLRFMGNVEGRDVFCGVCDVIVCDGFVGNVVLKLMEGMAGSVAEALMRELAGVIPQEAGRLRQAAAEIAARYDYNEYGGAPLLGVAGIFIICHGASNSRGIMNAVRVAKSLACRRVNERITELLSAGRGSPHA